MSITLSPIEFRTVYGIFLWEMTVLFSPSLGRESGWFKSKQVTGLGSGKLNNSSPWSAGSTTSSMADGSVLAGNLPGSPRNPLRDPGTEVEAPINAPVDCQGWRRLESTHMEHLPLDGPPEDLLTEEEAEDNDR